MNALNLSTQESELQKHDEIELEMYKMQQRHTQQETFEEKSVSFEEKVIDIDETDFTELNKQVFDMPVTISAALKDIAWLSGRFWVTHRSTACRIANLPTNMGITFSCHNICLGLFLCLTQLLPAFEYEYALKVGTAINGLIAILLILHSAATGLWQIMLIMSFYHGGIMVCGSYYLVPKYGNIKHYSFLINHIDDRYIDYLWCMWLILPIFVCLCFALIDKCVYKCVNGRWPAYSDPVWFPRFFDLMLRTYNGNMYNVMVLVYKNSLFGVSKKQSDKAVYCSKVFLRRQWGVCPCFQNNDDIKTCRIRWTTCLCTMWAVPWQCGKLVKCCMKKSEYKCEFIGDDACLQVKLYKNEKHNVRKLIDHYAELRNNNNNPRLGKGIFVTPKLNCPCKILDSVLHLIQIILFVLHMILLFPLVAVSALVYFIYFIFAALYAMLHGFIVLYFSCNCWCLSEYKWVGNKTYLATNYSYMIEEPSAVEIKRFLFYKQTGFFLSLLWAVYYEYCLYFAGLKVAQLITDENVVYYVHLWPTTYSKFVYEYDKITNKPVRIKGFIDDYSHWSSNESNTEFFENHSFEILSVFIDYDDDFRITFKLRNGEQIKQPSDPTGENEMRVWNIVKAHYECQISVYGSLVHVWAHFHLNDLTLEYIEHHWNDNMYDDDAASKPLSLKRTVFNRIVRSQSYHTAVLNKAGPNNGVVNPQTETLDWCTFVCMSWKGVPASTKVFTQRILDALDDYYFVDTNPEEKAQVIELRVASNDENIPKKVANPAVYPPVFVRDRLEIFNNEDWVIMHRGYSIYNDYLADYYEVIYKDFVLVLYKNKLITDKDLAIWIIFLEDHGFTGIVDCKRDDNYLHIFATFIWYSVVHSADHCILFNIIYNYGIGASHVEYKNKQWYLGNKNYDYRNVLSGKSCGEKCRLQFHGMRNGVFLRAFVDGKVDLCIVADYLIDPNLYHGFDDVNNLDDNAHKMVNKIHCKYISKLKHLDKKYSWLMPVSSINAGIHY